MTQRQVWLVFMGAGPFLLRAPAECKCGKIGRKGVLGAKPRNHIRPGAACRGPSVRNCPGGSGSPSSFALLHEIGSHLATALIPLTTAGTFPCSLRRPGRGSVGREAAFEGREAAARPGLRQVLKSDCKGHRVAS